ncbi:MAG: PDZ domain-containing protein [Campylobacterota bacterium]|nr:PDZ domain-containing protein [Campylobacterota bacterium]
MKRLFSPQGFKNILAVFVLLLLVKTLWFVVEILFLPTSGVTQALKSDAKSLYYRVKLTPNKIAAPRVKQPKVVVKKDGDIKEIKLLALYNDSKVTIVTVMHKKKTKVLSRGDNINGFVLENGGIDFANFSKNAKTYKVFLYSPKGKSKSSISEAGTKPVPTEEKKKDEKPKNELGDVRDAGDHKIIDRSLLDHYAKNMKDIYKDVGIGEVKSAENGLEGFRITFVRKSSPFAKLGIERNDVIKSINGQAITSYNAAFGVYKNIKNVENLTLVVKRGNEEMELEYEIE